MTLQFTQTPEDYIDFNLYLNWGSPAKKWTRIQTRYLPLALILVGILLKVKDLKYFFSTAVFFLCIGLLFIYLGPQGIKLGNRMRVRKMLIDPAHTELLGSRTLTFGPEVLTIVTPDSTAVVNLSAFREIVETADYFYLFLGVNQPIIVPKSAFSEVAEIQDFRALLKI